VTGPTKRTFLIVAVSALVLALAAASPFLLLAVSMRLEQRRINAKIEALRHETDHAAVLEACRWFMSHARGDELEYVTDEQPEYSHLPDAIRKLQPSFVAVTRKRVGVEFGGGFYHFGLTALAPNEPPPVMSGSLDHEKLREGLYLYWEK
jgi:hypothetical protein